ncbi:hypothetical protein EVAR_73222_1 [Eumeta japonica]|uniref:Uncharacterized protein n=1 Tax=Eumeta variegata TaxID=151549 RepID=A0A4C1T5U0_EUMVA|nr:hypothetical protein EVAR_73222_1 [Eumeta japonica]
MRECRSTKNIYTANACDERVGISHPSESYAGQIGVILKKGQIFSTRNQRACMKKLMEQDRYVKIVVAYENLWSPSTLLRNKLELIIITIRRHLHVSFIVPVRQSINHGGRAVQTMTSFHPDNRVRPRPAGVTSALW